MNATSTARTVFLPMLIILLMAAFEAGCSSSETSDGTSTGASSSSADSNLCLEAGQAFTFPSSARYLMAFHARPSSGETGPNSDDTYLAFSDDLVTWQIPSDYVPFCGSVPAPVRRENTLYVFNGGILRRYHIDTNQWDAAFEVTVKDETGVEVTYNLVDASPIKLSDGRLQLHYLVGDMGNSYDPAGCGATTTCTKTFKSATEVSGSDGADWVVDAGTRKSVDIDETDIAAERNGASDPDIFLGPDGRYYLMIMGSSTQTWMFAADSPSGTFTSIPTLTDDLVTTTLGAVPSGIYAGGKYWFFFTNPNEGGKISIVTAGSLAQTISSSNSFLEKDLRSTDFSTLGSSYTIMSASVRENIP